MAPMLVLVLVPRMRMNARMVPAAEERRRFPPPVPLPASPVPATHGPKSQHRPGRQLQSSWLPSSSTSCCLLASGYLQRLPSSSKVCCVLTWSCLTRCDPMDCSPPGSSVHGDSPGKNTEVGFPPLLQGIFLTQGSNLHLLCLLHWQAGSFTTSATGEAP